MGPKLSQPNDSLDVTYRLERSNFLLSQRSKKKLVLSSMFKRILTSNHPILKLDILSLPENTILQIIEYIPNDLKSLLSVSTFWYFRICEVIEHTFSSIESGFAIMHSHLINFKKSSLYFKEIRASGKKGFRVDRILVAEILPILKNYTVKLRYNYKYHKANIAYTAEFKIDCTERKKRTIWCHRDECRYHGADKIRSYTQQIPSVCIGDNIELAINWFSLYGLLKLDTIIWQPPIIQDTKKTIRALQAAAQDESTKKKLHLYMISRNCEPEANSSEWYDNKYYPPPPQAIISDDFLPFLKLIKFEFTGSEIIVSKSTFRAEIIGIVPESVSCIGICVEIVDDNYEIKQEVKRMGLLYDRHVPIRLRVGDELVLYISRGG